MIKRLCKFEKCPLVAEWCVVCPSPHTRPELHNPPVVLKTALPISSAQSPAFPKFDPVSPGVGKARA